MNFEKRAYLHIAKCELTDKPSTKTIKRYVKAITKFYPNFQNNGVQSILNKLQMCKQEVFDELFYPISENEFIPDVKFDFSTLIGNDKKFLKQDIFKDAFNHVLETWKQQSDTLIVIEPFKKKPFSQNSAYNFLKEYTDKDIIILSEIGIIPLYPNDMTTLYPFRYYDYINDENAKSPVKYNIKKLTKFLEKFNYSKVVFIGVHQSLKSDMHDVYFDITMNFPKLETEWIWSFHDHIWYKLWSKYGNTIKMSYTRDKDFISYIRKILR